jgi:hypothetical protein
MISRRTAAAVAALLLAAPAHLAHAQDSTVSASTARNLLGLGVNMTGGGGMTPSFQLGREWRAPGSRFALRLTGDYNTSESHNPLYRGYYYPGPPAGLASMSTRDATLGLATTFTLSQGRIQPYLISGMYLGYHNLRSRYDANPDFDAGGLPNFSYAVRQDEGTLGLQAGFGLSTRIRGVSMFTEYRYFQPLGSTTAYATQPRPRPLTFGFRF